MIHPASQRKRRIQSTSRRRIEAWFRSFLLASQCVALLASCAPKHSSESCAAPVQIQQPLVEAGQWAWAMFTYLGNIWITSFHLIDDSWVDTFDYRIGAGGAIREMRDSTHGYSRMLGA